VREARLREALLDARVPGAAGAEERGRRLVRAAYAASPPALQRRRRTGARRGLQVALAVGLLAVAISPAGAAVRDWVGDAVDPAREPALPALTSLPAPGALLVDSARGPWIVHEDGSKRLLGAYRESTWSPRGLYVAATNRHELAAVDPLGEVRWTIARAGPIRMPAWSPDGGYRVAYLNGDELRVVGGDGTGDRPVAPRVAAVAPAWEPGSRHLLSFVAPGGTVRTVQADNGRLVFERSVGGDPSHLAWSPDGERLLVSTRNRLEALDRGGEIVWRARAPRGMDIVAGTIAPDGDRAAALMVSKAGDHSELALFGPGSDGRVLFVSSGRFDDAVYSPDGSWVLLTWRSADQWLFVDLADPRRIVAISDISAQFAPGTTSPPPFPEVAGWCCPADAAGSG
jgi:hypothetical protein